MDETLTPANQIETIDEVVRIGEAQGQPEGKARLGFFHTNAKQNADNVFVLVVHYDFAKEKQWIRAGDAEDVEKLRKTFKENRNCNFRSILSPRKEILLQLLSDEEKLLQFFSSKDVPSVFVLFFLSHGDRDGKIWTDHRSENNQLGFIHFNTEDVFRSLKNLTKFEKCLKFTVFGPCRGKLEDEIFSPSKDISNYDNRNSCRITSSPAMNNLFIFYSTVETTMAVRSEKGSWITNSFCNVLNSIGDDKPLLVVLSMMQFQIHKVSQGCNLVTQKYQGQTPEIKMFAQNQTFTVAK
ncbi:uncharacterized protein LOC135943107 [Cloeon dipterum]|uniref:uncharacterized protein LOC135943107 n=1 Tax=Cloeon dipterum TaxID=197152 RepID=UPI00321F88EB